MNISIEVFKQRWSEVSNFDFQKLLEDNQNLSLPMITLVNKRPIIFAFVYTISTKGKIIVSQRHFWNIEEHQMMICKKSYISNNMHMVDIEKYFELFYKVVELLFKDNLTPNEEIYCKKYFSFFEEFDIGRIYFSENQSLFRWAKTMSIL